MIITLHRYSRSPLPGDLTDGDLAVLWGLLKAEGLIGTLFHDGNITTLHGFLAWAKDPGQWTYAAKKDGLWIGLGAVNGFCATGNTAFAHLASFEGGRDGSFAEAGRQWFGLLRKGGLDTLVAILPACYRGARLWAGAFGFVQRMRLPGAMRILRPGGWRVTDMTVYQCDLDDNHNSEGC